MLRAMWIAVFIAAASGIAPAATAAAESACADGSCEYANCTEAEESGVCDIREGDPAYCSKQDRDRDGIACECTDW